LIQTRIETKCSANGQQAVASISVLRTKYKVGGAKVAATEQDEEEIARLRPSTSLATAEKIGPSSEASSLSPRSCSRRLMVFSGVGFSPQVLDVRPIRLEPRGVSVA
jgi:hypothetical protein